jgi:hypothetical protein
MLSSYRVALVLVAGAIIAGCGTTGEINRLNAELSAANQRNLTLLEAKARYCGEMSSAAARVERAKLQTTSSNVASALLGGAIDWIAGKPVTTALKIFMPDLFATAAPQPDVLAATREMSAGLARYCDGPGGRNAAHHE